MKNIELSIVIVNYNTEKLTLQSIKSVIKYKPSVNSEIIVVDNGSSDGSVKVLQKLKEIKLIKNKDNLGFSKGNNIGIKNAKGKYVLLLNSDTEVKKGTIDSLHNFAKGDDKVGAVAARLLNPDGTPQASIYNLPNMKNAFLEYWLGKKGAYEKYLPKGENPIKVEAAVMAAFLITPNGLKKAGLLNENYFIYFEDLDYCRKLKQSRLDIYYLPSAEVIHHHGVSGRNLADEQNQWRRLIPSSKIYHGVVVHHLINLIIWSGQKWRRLL